MSVNKFENFIEYASHFQKEKFRNILKEGFEREH